MLVEKALGPLRRRREQVLKQDVRRDYLVMICRLALPITIIKGRWKLQNRAKPAIRIARLVRMAHISTAVLFALLFFKHSRSVGRPTLVTIVALRPKGTRTHEVWSRGSLNISETY